jgi:hypothetical protein
MESRTATEWPFQKGEPENPMGQEELAGKFRQCARDSLYERAVEQLLDLIMGMDNIEDLSGLFSILRRGSEHFL